MMKKLDKVVWGIIGAGNVCEQKSAPALYKVPFSEVKTVMRRNGEKAEDFAKRHGIKNWTTDVEKLMTDSEINAIYIATPPDSHASLCIRAANAGKAVYVEKPMANTQEECEAMIQACKLANVPLFVAYYRRALPGFLHVKELIENGSIGDVRTVNIEMCKALREADFDSKNNWRVQPQIAGGGYFHDLASHQLNYLDYLFGKIKKATGISANQAGIYPADDIVTACFEFENGVIGSGNWCFSTDQLSEKDMIKIIGSKGELEFNCFNSPMTILLKSKISGNQEFNFDHAQPIQESLVEKIVAELTGHGIAPETALSGYRTTAVMSKITG